MRSLVLLILATLALPCITMAAADCPNLTGFYWQTAQDKPRQGMWGSMMEIRQKDCEKLTVYVHWVNEQMKVVHEDRVGSAWDLTGKTCRFGRPGEKMDCRKHTVNADSVITHQNSRFNTPEHGDCFSDRFAWSLGSDGHILNTEPVKCVDGFSGDYVTVIERAK